MAKKTTLEKLDVELDEILNEYANSIYEGVEEAKIAVGKAGVKMLKQSAQQFNGTGEYAKSWAVDAEKSRTGNTVVIYSKIPSRPHLLEYGHAKVGKKGGRVPAYPHIQPVEEKLNAMFKNKVKAVVEK